MKSQIKKQHTPESLASEMLVRGTEWAELNAAAKSKEEARKSVLAAIMCKMEGLSNAAAETHALATPQYQLFITEMVEARKLADIARVRFDVWQAFIDLYRSQMATERAEAKAFGG